MKGYEWDRSFAVFATFLYTYDNCCNNETFRLTILCRLYHEVSEVNVVKNVLNKPEEQNQTCLDSALAEKGRMKSKERGRRK